MEVVDSNLDNLSKTAQRQSEKCRKSPRSKVSKLVGTYSNRKREKKLNPLLNHALVAPEGQEEEWGGGAEIDDELPLDTEAATLQTINPDRDKIIKIIIIIIKGLP